MRPARCVRPRRAEIFDEANCGKAVRRWTEFYKHESWKCTPCRWHLFGWIRSYERLEVSVAMNIDKLLDTSDSILGKVVLRVGDGAASPVMSPIKHFRYRVPARVEAAAHFRPSRPMLVANGVE